MSRRIVITGYDLMTALGFGKEENSRRLFSGESGITETVISAAGESVHGMVGAAGDLPDTDFFKKNGLKPDRCTQMALLIAERCMEEAGMSASSEEADRFGICVGTSLGGMLSGDHYHETWLNDGFEAADGEELRQYPLHAVADVVALRFGLKGYRNIISTACAASGNAIGYAFDVIRDGSQDMMIAGGVDPLSRFSFSGFTSLKAIDTEACQPYSNSRGINLGEGAAFFVLEEYEHAVKRGARILAEVYACGLSADAYHQTAPAKGGVGAIRSMRAALSDAGFAPEDISYVNGHGTGTPANDVNETLAFQNVFGDMHIPLSSTKGATGHTLGAAGAVECAISLMALEANMAPPTIRFTKDPGNGVNYVPNHSQPLRMDRILSNSFAFGGNNCSIIIGREGKGTKKEECDDEIVITGIGCAGVGGADIAQLYDTFRNRKRCTGIHEAYVDTPYAGKYAGRMTEVSWKKYIPAPMLRRINEITRLTMATGKMALTDARWNINRENMNHTGILYSTGTGPLETIESINRSILTHGISAVDPSAFPNSVLNAAAGNLSIACQLKGPITAISVGQASGLIGVDYAVRILKHHQADAMIAVCADEICDALQMGFNKLGYASVSGLPAGAAGADGLIISPGSVSLLLERRSDAMARGARIYGSIRGFGMVSEDSEIAGFKDDSTALRQAAHEALEQAGIEKPDLYVSALNGINPFDRAELKLFSDIADGGTLVTAPQALLGTPIGSVGGYGILSALYSFKEGQVVDLPDGEYKVDPEMEQYLHKGENRRADIRTALVSATSFGGTCTCMVIGKEP